MSYSLTIPACLLASSLPGIAAAAKFYGFMPPKVAVMYSLGNSGALALASILSNMENADDPLLKCGKFVACVIVGHFCGKALTRETCGYSVSYTQALKIHFAFQSLILPPLAAVAFVISNGYMSLPTETRECIQNCLESKA